LRLEWGRPVSRVDDYRPDIDGLRAIAVAVIVGFHALPRLVPGGFVGVDIFFVISGFLITRMISQDLDNGAFSMGRFYLRRARRIIPAYAAVVLVTTIIGGVILLPVQLEAFGRSLAASAVFASNIFFWLQHSYFSPPAEYQPLLHLWSLSVEEQFYLIWPLGLLILAHRRLAPFRTIIVSIAVISSLALAQMKVGNGSFSSFYLLPPRAWEFGLGALVALCASRAPRRAVATEGLAIVGLGLIFFSVAFYTHHTPFPGLSALAPCVGSALVILSGVHRPPRVTALLRSAPFVGVGLISYSLYLWHWPLLVFARQVTQHPLDWPVACGGVVLSLALAYLSWRWIELPFRKHQPGRTWGRLVYPVVAACLTLLVAGLGLVSLNGAPQRVSPSILATQAASLDRNPMRARCHIDSSPAFPSLGQCRTDIPGRTLTGNGYEVLVWGDSYADAATPGVVAWAKSRDLFVRQVSRSACPPLLNLNVFVEPEGLAEGCPKFNRTVLAEIAANRDLHYIVLAARWAYYADGDTFGDEPSYHIRLRPEGEKGHPDAPGSAAEMAAAVQPTVAAIRKAARPGVVIIVIRQPPELGFDAPGCLSQRRFLHLSTTPCSGATLDAIRRRGRSADVAMQRFGSDVVFIDPVPPLCGTGTCEVERGTRVLYVDDDHLSATGARMVLTPLLDAALRPR